LEVPNPGTFFLPMDDFYQWHSCGLELKPFVNLSNSRYYRRFATGGNRLGSPSVAWRPLTPCPSPA
jgi:hypothetical protein